jgi:hypothetical protein
MSRTFMTIILLVMVATIGGCTVQRENAETIASDVSRDVAKVKQTFQGKNGAPILVLEEQHDSRATQIQEAIVLNRLLNDHKIKHIGLEGYIKEQSALTSDWFFKDAHNSQAAHPVAVTLLKEGEISSAEFTKLAYVNTVLAPIETRSEFEMQEPEGKDVFFVCINIIYRIALKSLRPEQETKVEQVMMAANDHKGDKQSQAKKMNEAAAKYLVKTLMTEPSSLSSDTWVSNTVNTLKNEASAGIMPLEQEVELYKGIQSKAQEAAINLDSDQQKTLNDFVTFLKNRMAASKTMVDAIAPIADQRDVYAVAMVVGAAHTDGVCKLLRDAERPFAVIRPDALDTKDDLSVIPAKMFLKKYQGGSIYSGGITQTLLEAFPGSTGHHPPPVMQQRWFEAKSELYLYTERISHDLLGSNNGGGKIPPPTGTSNLEPPYGFGDNDFRGSFIYIDPRKIKIVPDGINGKGRAVLFPVQMNPNDPVRTKIVWAKAARVGDEVPPANEKEHVEKLLKDALHDVEEDNMSKNSKQVTKPDDKELTEKEAGKKETGDKASKETGDKASSEKIADAVPLKVEDEVGRVKITRETIASYSPSEEDAMRTVISGQ